MQYCTVGKVKIARSHLWLVQMPISGAFTTSA